VSDAEGPEPAKAFIEENSGALRREIAAVRQGLRNDLRRQLGGLEQRVEAYQEANRLGFRRLEDKMDAHHEATPLVLRDILRRLPEPSA
jgi:hypothetical protein